MRSQFWAHFLHWATVVSLKSLSFPRQRAANDKPEYPAHSRTWGWFVRPKTVEVKLTTLDYVSCFKAFPATQQAMVHIGWIGLVWCAPFRKAMPSIVNERCRSEVQRLLAWSDFGSKDDDLVWIYLNGDQSYRTLFFFLNFFWLMIWVKDVGHRQRCSVFPNLYSQSGANWTIWHANIRLARHPCYTFKFWTYVKLLCLFPKKY